MESARFQPEVLKSFTFWAGGLAGVVSAAATHQLDVAKTLRHVGKPMPSHFSDYFARAVESATSMCDSGGDGHGILRAGLSLRDHAAPQHDFAVAWLTFRERLGISEACGAQEALGQVAERCRTSSWTLPL